MSNPLKQELLSSVACICSACSWTSIRDVSVVVKSLGTLGLRWTSVQSESLKASILNGISMSLRRGERDEVAGVIFGMGMMDFSWQSLSDSLRKEIVKSVKRLFGPQGESFMKAARFQSQQAKGSLVQSSSFNYASTAMTKSQALANMMYGFALLVFDTENSTLIDELNEIHFLLLDEVSKMGVGSFSEAEKEQILIYMNLHQLTPTHSAPNKIKLKADNNKEEKVSRLQQSVVSSLRGK